MKARWYRILLIFGLLASGADALRVLEVVQDTPENAEDVRLPSSSQDWEVTYQFTVPPLPRSATWNPDIQTVYLWGDIDFDKYGGSSPYSISSYKYNQLLPQLMTGNVLSESDSGYRPNWNTFEHWIIQASYYWMDDKKVSYAQTGKTVDVKPGELITSSIRYSANAGELTVQISGKAGTSIIHIPRPFPNDHGKPFSNWKEFFKKAEAKSSGLFGHPDIAVEPHHTDSATVCSILPFSVRQAALSGEALDIRPFKLTRKCGNRLVRQIVMESSDDY